MAKVEESALGVKVVKGVKPDQQLVKVVNDELVNLMGGEKQDLNEPRIGPQVRQPASVIMLLIAKPSEFSTCKEAAFQIERASVNRATELANMMLRQYIKQGSNQMLDGD